MVESMPEVHQRVPLHAHVQETASLHVRITSSAFSIDGCKTSQRTDLVAWLAELISQRNYDSEDLAAAIRSHLPPEAAVPVDAIYVVTTSTMTLDLSSVTYFLEDLTLSREAFL